MEYPKSLQYIIFYGSNNVFARPARVDFQIQKNA